MLCMSFMACPLPVSPTGMMLLAKAASVGRHASTMAAAPPAISVSVPASAALAPPVMPQSTYSRPVALASAASSRVVAGCDVVRSIRICCSCGWCSSPSLSQSSARISAEPGTTKITLLTAPKALGGASTTAADRSAHRASALQSQAATRRPARSRFLAIPRPICPRPITAVLRSEGVLQLSVIAGTSLLHLGRQPQRQLRPGDHHRQHNEHDQVKRDRSQHNLGQLAVPNALDHEQIDADRRRNLAKLDIDDKDDAEQNRVDAIAGKHGIDKRHGDDDHAEALD